MTKNILILIIVVCFIGFVVWLLLNKDKSIQQDLYGSMTPVATPTPIPVIQESPGPVMNYPGGLKVQDVVLGTGAEAKKGKIISVHYVGTLENGIKFDSSVDRGEPFNFVLGAGQVIQGWDEGFNGMKVGGKRKLIIPPAMAYGSKGAGNIVPPNATLFFDVELLAVADPQ